MIFAQGTPAASFVVNAWWLALALLGGAASVAVIYTAFRKKEKRTIEPNPLNVEGEIKVTPKGRRWNASEYDHRQTELDRRLDGHDVQIDKLWFTLRDEDAKTRKSLETAVRDFDQTVNRMDGTLKAVNETQNMILQRMLKEVR